MAARGIEATLLATLRDLGNAFGAERVADAAGQVLRTASRTKAVVDDNVAAVLGLAGIPSRAEIDALQRQLDAVQATLANLSRKLDRLLEDGAGREHHPRSPAARLRRAKRHGGDSTSD